MFKLLDIPFQFRILLSQHTDLFLVLPFLSAVRFSSSPTLYSSQLAFKTRDLIP